MTKFAFTVLLCETQSNLFSVTVMDLFVIIATETKCRIHKSPSQ